MSISGIVSSIRSLAGPSVTGSTSSGSTGRAQRSPAEDFLAYARMSPAERMRATALQEMGLTEDSTRSMNNDTRDRVEVAIREKIKAKVQQSTQSQTGMILDVAM